MIKIEEESGDKNLVKLWCPECRKTLKLEEFTKEIPQAFLDIVDSLAQYHQQRHPKHNPNIIIKRSKNGTS